MFGYVTASKCQLGDEDYGVFCSYYCGLCRAMGRECSQISRLTLSYDICFLALVLSAVFGDGNETAQFRCAVHPGKKRRYVRNDRAVDYAASVGTILSYLKMSDDREDDGSRTAAAGMFFLRHGYVRACGKYPEVSNVIKQHLSALGKLENERCSSVDMAADEFAMILESVFTPGTVTDAAQRRSLSWLGYNLGRWIYMIDAYNDMDDDAKSGSYNPFLAGGAKPEEVRRDDGVKLSLTVTLENIASAFELLDIKRNKNVIGKIIYISLKQKQEAVFAGEKVKTAGRRCGAVCQNGHGGISTDGSI